ncbi:hypothetical protein [Nevskia sp.]|uniref:hypothetical protein n=1 Tax=Nevskia sp. TaxID=1929292 RepID=UPI003F7082FD
MKLGFYAALEDRQFQRKSAIDQQPPTMRTLGDLIGRFDVIGLGRRDGGLVAVTGRQRADQQQHQ